MQQLKNVAVFVACGALVGCTATDPEPFHFDAGVGQDVLPLTPDIEYVCPTVAGAAPIIQSAPQTTGYRSVPIRGVAPGAQTVVAEGPSGVAKPAAVGANGKFCLDVELIPEAMNVISVVAMKDGCKTQVAKVQVRHEVADKAEGPKPTVQNVALGSPTAASVEPERGGVVAMLTDGELADSVEFDMFDPDVQMTNDKYIWVRVDLRKVYTVSRLKLHWGRKAKADKSYAVSYAVLLSSAEHPEDPAISTDDWITVKETEKGDAGIQELTFSPERARWAAVLLFEDDATRWNAYEKFAIAEFEVYGQDPNGVPPPTPDSCY